MPEMGFQPVNDGDMEAERSRCSGFVSHRTIM
jgi:hypothetical protein